MHIKFSPDKSFYNRLFFLCLHLYFIGLPLSSFANLTDAQHFAEANEDKLVIVAVYLGRFKLTDGLLAYIHNDGLLLPFGHLMNLLEFPITISRDNRSAEGWFIKEQQYFNLDTHSQQVTIKGHQNNYDKDNVFIYEEDIYVSNQLIVQWFPIDFTIDFSRLTIIIESRDLLPLQIRINREKRWQKNQPSDADYQIKYPSKPSPYSWLDWPFIDNTFNSNLQKSSKGIINRQQQYQALITGDFLKMSSELTLNIQKNKSATMADHKLQTDGKLRLYRKEPARKLLGLLKATQFSMGDIYSPNHELITDEQQGLGFIINNYRLEQASKFDETLLQGTAVAGWDAELYHNETLIDFQTINDDGRYRFEHIPLLFGFNHYRVMLYGPQGQEQEINLRRIINESLFSPGQWNYQAGIIRENDSLFGNTDDAFFQFEEQALNTNQTNPRYYLSTGYGVSNSFSFKTTYDSFFVNKQRHHYTSLQLLSSTNGLLSEVDISKDWNGGYAFRGLLQTQWKHLNIVGDYQYFNAFNHKNQQTKNPVRQLAHIRLNGFLKITSWPQISYGLNFQHNKLLSGEDRWTISQRFGTRLWKTNMSNNLLLGQDNGNRTLGGVFLLRGNLNKYSLSGRAQYGLDPVYKLRNLNFTLNWKRSNKFNTRIQWQYDLEEKKRSYLGLGLNWRFSWATLGLTARYQQNNSYQIGFSISNGLSRNPINGNWQAAKSLANHGAVASRVFLDHNLNHVFDDMDEVLENVRFQINDSPKKATTDKNGIALLTDMTTFKTVDFDVHSGSFEDPFWVALTEGISVTPRPGKVTRVDFPVSVSGEVDGMVYLQKGDHKKAVADAVVQLINENGEIVQEVESGYDGFYLIQGVLPGAYQLRISPQQLKRLGLFNGKLYRVIIAGDGTIVSNRDFTLSSLQSTQE